MGLVVTGAPLLLSELLCDWLSEEELSEELTDELSEEDEEVEEDVEDEELCVPQPANRNKDMDRASKVAIHFFIHFILSMMDVGSDPHRIQPTNALGFGTNEVYHELHKVSME